MKKRKKFEVSLTTNKSGYDFKIEDINLPFQQMSKEQLEVLNTTFTK